MRPWTGRARAMVPPDVATTIYFTASKGDRLASLMVKEEMSEIHSAMLSGGADQPLLLTVAAGKEQRVYVNPLNIAYWQTTPDATARFS